MNKASSGFVANAATACGRTALALGLALAAAVPAYAQVVLPPVVVTAPATDGGTVLCTGDGCANLLASMQATAYFELHDQEPPIGEPNDAPIDLEEFCSNLSDQEPDDCGSTPPPAPLVNTTLAVYATQYGSGCGDGSWAGSIADFIASAIVDDYSGDPNEPMPSIEIAIEAALQGSHAVQTALFRNRRRRAGDPARHRWWRNLQDLRFQRRRGHALQRERWQATEQFVQHAAERIDVASHADRPAEQLLGRRVAETQIAVARGGRLGRVQRLGDAEVQQADLAARIDEDVAAPDVPMHEEVLMRMTDRRQHLAEQQQALFEAQAVAIGVAQQVFTVDGCGRSARGAASSRRWRRNGRGSASRRYADRRCARRLR